ncbi:NDR1/HIN1-like protein 2 [Cucurbita maxima]|uniref:NDR1/HIN1-like protein 2 n=1 Tax=Cucurbita maxima TaxID=3661 RepID=A0A6J1K154_CUCMA|nr:NDR1/HIN1-like protein 2 [Cucurbita maxima]
MADSSRPVTGYPAYPNGHLPPSNSQPHDQAYPYAAPPYSYPSHYANPYDSTHQNARISFLRAIIAGIIVIFIITAVILFIIWLVLRPQLPEFRVDSFQVTNFSAASQSLSAAWFVGFSVFNPNKKMSISYDFVDSTVFYKNQILSETRVPPFIQDKRTHTVVNASFSSLNAYIDASSVNDINDDRRRGAVKFDVGLSARVGFRAGWWRARRRLLRVLCEDLSVGLSLSNSSASGKLLGESRSCRVAI